MSVAGDCCSFTSLIISKKISKPKAIKIHPYYTWTLSGPERKKTKQKWSNQFVVLPHALFHSSQRAVPCRKTKFPASHTTPTPALFFFNLTISLHLFYSYYKPISVVICRVDENEARTLTPNPENTFFFQRLL